MITCYIQPDKPKSRRVLEAFAMGCSNARIATTREPRLQPGTAVFYGVRPQWLHLLQQAIREGRDWYYIDNAWFDDARGEYFRVGHNAMQSWRQQPSDGKRLAQLGIEVMPWQRSGRDIVICSQSEEFMRTIANWPDGELGWRSAMQRQARRQIGRGMIQRDKHCPRSLSKDLANAYMLVTHSSASAVQALIAGVPVMVTDPSCAAAQFSGSLDKPLYAAGREDWAARLADSQWTLAEMRSGMAWEMVRRS